MVASFFPRTLEEALQIRAEHPVIPVAGGTDLMVARRSWSGTLPRFEKPLLFLGGIEALKEMRCDGEILTLGAAVTLTALLKKTETPELLRLAVARMASPAIRNAGTVGGNIVHASPAADTVPPLLALDAAVILQSTAGAREMPLDEFIQGPGRTALAANELLIGVKLPVSSFPVVAYKKVGTRKADALSKIAFAGLALIREGRIAEVRLALGAVAPRPIRRKDEEQRLTGRSLLNLPEWLPEVERAYAGWIQPIDDQRSSAVYRRTTAVRLIADFMQGLKKGLEE